MSLETKLLKSLHRYGIDNKLFVKSLKAQRKFFIISFGPPASGKGGMKIAIQNFLETQLVDVNVDQIVEKICSRTLVNYDCSKIDQETYFKLREQADKESDQLLIDSVINRQNVIWETTGANLGWIMQALFFMKENNYEVILSVPIVGLNQLITRCEKRPQAANCSREYLSKVRGKFSKDFPKIAEQADRVLIFDNSQKQSFLIYDSLDQYCNKINFLGQDPNQTPLHEYFVSKCGSKSN